MKGKGDVVRSFTLLCSKSLIVKLIRTNCTHKESLNTVKIFFLHEPLLFQEHAGLKQAIFFNDTDSTKISKESEIVIYIN